MARINHKTIHAALIILLLLLFIVHPGAIRAAQTNDSPSVIVMPFENLSGRSEYNWIGEGYATGLADLLNKPGIVSIESEERELAYKQEGLPPTAILTRATMIKIAERVRANLIIMGTYRITGDGRDSRIAVTARLVNISEGRLVGRELNRGGLLLDMQQTLGEIAYDLINQYNPALQFSRDQIVTEAIRIPVTAYENFIKGRLTHDREARTGFLEKAAKEYSEKNNAPYQSALFELGQTKFEAGDFNQALDNLSKIDEKNPHYSQALFLIGSACYSLGQTEKALATYKKLAPACPLYEVYNNIGVLLIKTKDYKEAIKHLDPAVEAAPRDADTLFNLGYAYYLANENAAAAGVFRRTLERRPSDGEAYYFLSKVLTATGDQPGALDAADKAKRMLTSFAQWETNGAPFLGRMKNGFSKANYYRFIHDKEEDASVSGPGANPEIQAKQYLESARKAFNAGRNEEALSLVGKLLQAMPQNFEAHMLMGQINERRGDYERAINSFKAALFWNSKLVAAHVMLGRIAILKKDCQSAVESVNKALQLEPGNQEAQALKRIVDEKCKANPPATTP